MEATDEFSALLTRVRGGDEEAAAELVRRYEPDIRRIISVRLTDPNLRRSVDSLDICQSVLIQFFVRVRMGQFDLREPKDLVRLLTTMVQNKVYDKARKPAHRKTRSAESGVLRALAASGESPSEIVAGEELVASIRANFSQEELDLATARADGRSWEEIAAGLGISIEAARKRLKRSIDRALKSLGLDENSDD